MCGRFLSSQFRSLYHVPNESSVKDKHDLYLSWRHAAWCHLCLNVPFHCGAWWCITDLCMLCRKLYIYIFLFWLTGDKDTEISVRKNWVKRRCKEPFCADLNLIAVVCLCIVMCLFYLADLWYYVASFYARITNVCGDWVRRHILLLRPQLDLSPAIKVDFVMMFRVFMVW